MQAVRRVPVPVLALVIAVQLAAAVWALRGAPTVPEPGPLPRDATRSGFVAVVDGSSSPCLRVVDVATGTARELTCDGAGDFAGWSSAGQALLLGSAGRPTRAVDPITGVIAPTDLDRPLTGIPPVSVASTSEGGRVSLAVDGATLWRASVPDGYRLGQATPSPDGRHVMAIDSLGRLLLADTRVPGDVFVAATSVARAAWFDRGRFPTAVVEAPPTRR